MIRRPPRSTQSRSSAASDVYKRQDVTVAHKHGWAYEVDDGYIHTIADAGIVYTPGGDYVLSIFAYHPVQAVFEPVNQLFAKLSQAVYSYYNLTSTQ